jgi:hypothetical protein
MWGQILRSMGDMRQQQMQILRNLGGMFEQLWELLAIHGMCDAVGSAEYLRVRREWREAYYPAGLVAFIRSRANLPAPAEPGKEVES